MQTKRGPDEQQRKFNGKRLQPIIQEENQKLKWGQDDDDANDNNNKNYRRANNQYNNENIGRKKDELEDPISHNSAMTHATYLNEKEFRQCYPLSSQILLTLKQKLFCRNKTSSYVDELHWQERQRQDLKIGPSLLTEKIKDMIEHQVLYVQLGILSTSPLEQDTNLMHPFVRVHILDKVSGQYVQKNKTDKNEEVIYNFESIGIVSKKDNETDNKSNVAELKQNNNQTEHKSHVLDFIPPFATNGCDMRFTNNSRAIWNQNIIINEPAETFFQPNIIILFEILDFCPLYLKAKKFDNLDLDFYYRIAWGYLRPNGFAQLHQGLVKLQLYKYQFEPKKMNKMYHTESTPLVYFDFIWQEKKQYDGVLNINFKFIDLPNPEEVEIKKASQSVFQIEMGDLELKKKINQQDEEISEKGLENKELSNLDKLNLRRRRFLGEESKIPEKIAFRYLTQPLGCYRLTFNKKGNFLAAACTQKSSKTIINIYDVESDSTKQWAQFKGHSNLIHDIRFSQSSSYLVTASSDQTAKIWRVPRSSSDPIVEEESDHYLVSQLAHPSFVYSALFLQDGYYPIVVTASFDQRLRIWRIDSKNSLVVQQEPQQWYVISRDGNTFDTSENLTNHRHPNSLVYDNMQRLYVGDSQGGVTIFDINLKTKKNDIAVRINFIENYEISGSPINSLQIVPTEYKDLLIHSRDNCIRMLEISGSEGKYTEESATQGIVAQRYFGAISSKLCIRSAISPCGQYILSGSEDGKPYLWNNTGKQEPSNQFQYNLLGPITDVAWNETYHMIALAGFGDEHPINVYTFEKEDGQNMIDYKELQEKLVNKSKKKDQVF